MMQTGAYLELGEWVGHILVEGCRLEQLVYGCLRVLGPHVSKLHPAQEDIPAVVTWSTHLEASDDSLPPLF